MTFLDNISYRISGDRNKPKLVFLHGLMGYAANWRRIIPAFEEDYQILAYDQRGHGNSFHPDKGYRIEDYADDLLRIMEELGWQKVTLVGHSLGGRNALNFAFRMPQYVNKLVIEDIGPNINVEAVRRIQKILETVPTPFSGKKEAKEYFMNDFSGDAILGQYLYSNIKDKGSQCDWRFSKEGILASLTEGFARERWEELEGIQVPTLVIRGETSQELPRDQFDKMLSCSNLVSGVEVPGAGHWVHYDQAEKFTRALKDFLD